MGHTDPLLIGSQSGARYVSQSPRDCDLTFITQMNTLQSSFFFAHNSFINKFYPDGICNGYLDLATLFSFFFFVLLITLAAFSAILTVLHRTSGLSAGSGEGRESRLCPDTRISNSR